MRRRSVLRPLAAVTVAVGIGLIALAPAAGAASKRVPVANPDFTSSAFCSFPVSFHATVNNEYETVTPQPDGSTLIKIEGSLFATLTNGHTGKSITVNIGGPGTITVNADGSSSSAFRGRSLFFFAAAPQATFGVPGMLLTSGLVNFTQDSSGNFTSFAPNGNSTDECAALS
jgi:hypothetical protein